MQVPTQGRSDRTGLRWAALGRAVQEAAEREHVLPSMWEAIKSSRDTVYTVHSTLPQQVQPLVLISNDTRLCSMRYPYAQPLGPGDYNPDPLGDLEIGPYKVPPQASSRSRAPGRDPGRPSAIFEAPGRDKAKVYWAPEQPPMSDYTAVVDWQEGLKKQWLASGIQKWSTAERWGKAWDQPRKAVDRPEISDALMRITADGKPASTAAFLADRDTAK